MVQALQVITIVVVSVAMALSLAHALELPGKLRLSKEHYLVTQQIYYPGFTFGGLAEPIGLLLLLALLLVTPVGAKFWLTTAAFLAFLLMHATYWLVTHPVNKFWLKDFQPEKLAEGFFSFDPLGHADRLRARTGEHFAIGGNTPMSYGRHLPCSAYFFSSPPSSRCSARISAIGARRIFQRPAECHL